ncbi:DUF2125 domain-containing protein [Lentibacter sp.]|uniref:DUF2125 domain-containing protein n=1 Tax=Lentibacter sp. TaxID=2024994 RepID=UPI003F6CDE93
MFLRRLLLGSTALALSATSSLADVTAQDVWMDWKAYMQGFGYSVQGVEATSGDTLTVSDIRLAMALPDDDERLEASLPQIAFTNLSNGTVEIALPAELPIAFDYVDGATSEATGVIDYNTTDFSLIASGTPSEMTYTYSATTLDLGLRDLVVEGKPVDLGTIAFTMTGLAGTSLSTEGTLRNIAQNMTAEALSYTVAIEAPDGSNSQTSFKMAGLLNNLAFDGTGSYPTDGNFDVNNMASMFEAGFNMLANFTYAGGTSSFETTERGVTTKGQSSSESGMFKVAMSADGLSYGGEASGLTSNMTVPQLPFPIEINAAKSAFGLTAPVSASDTPQDFALSLELSDFTTSEGLWALIDPTAQLPRDPATLHIDVSGKATLLFDVMDSQSMASVETGAQKPGELNALDINTLKLSLAGAELTGGGAFTFDNSDMATFNGMPKPTGAVDLQLVGGNGLIDKLVAMGLVAEEQAMGARMMMGLFAVAGEGADTLNSKIEVNEQGQVFANGQRLR